ncbi:restriction endonuclease subunit S [Chryseobacterium luteum]|uniref:restriction endonuclease subunit S n=1 Tax=Chryseobacterium luteum TaxID=421531 RepID=UPI000692382F|nr:restriction endonuclease subunit S [Chryseobacterium luteum]
MKLGDLCDVVRGSSPRPQGDSRYFGGNIPRLMIADVTRDGKYVTPTIDSLTEEGAKKSRPMKKGDVVIAVSGDPGRPCILAVDACIHDGFVGLRNLDESEILKSYLFCFLNYFKLVNRKNAVGAIFQNLTTDQIKKIDIPRISIDKQINIVEIITKADTLITQRKESILMLDELLKSSFLDMFGDPVKNEKGWVVKKLKDVCIKITDGTHFSPPIVDVGIPYITAKHVRENKIDFWAKPWFISEEDHKEIYKRCSPKKGDILYIKDGATTGYSAINRYDFEFSMLSSLALLKVNCKILNAEYLNSWLNNDIVKTRILKGMAGGAIKRLTLTKINQLPINVPPIELQNRFATVVEKVETLKAEYQKSLVELENMYGVLSQQAFKGELKIK